MENLFMREYLILLIKYLSTISLQFKRETSQFTVDRIRNKSDNWLSHWSLSQLTDTYTQLTLFDLGSFLCNWTSSSILTVDWNWSQPLKDLWRVYIRDPHFFKKGGLHRIRRSAVILCIHSSHFLLELINEPSLNMHSFSLTCFLNC